MTDRRAVRIAIGTCLALPALAILGEVLAPDSWDPPPVPYAWAYRSVSALPRREVSTPIDRTDPS